jgi:hypothetical protein
MENDALKRIYDTMSQDYDMGSFGTFVKKMAAGGTAGYRSRKAVYDAMSGKYDMGSYDDFAVGIGYRTREGIAAQRTAAVGGGGTARPSGKAPAGASPLPWLDASGAPKAATEAALADSPYVPESVRNAPKDGMAAVAQAADGRRSGKAGQEEAPGVAQGLGSRYHRNKTRRARTLMETGTMPLDTESYLGDLDGSLSEKRMDEAAAADALRPESLEGLTVTQRMETLARRQARLERQIEARREELGAAQQEAMKHGTAEEKAAVLAGYMNPVGAGQQHEAQDGELQSLKAALDMNTEALRTLERVNAKGDGPGVVAGFADAARKWWRDPLSVKELRSMMAAYGASQGLKGGRAATAAGKAALEGLEAHTAAGAKASEELKWTYGMGEMAFNSVVFGAEFLSTGGMGAMRSAGARKAVTLARKAVTSAVGRAVRNRVGAAAGKALSKAAYGFVKGTGIAASDVVAGYAMSATVQLPRTAADAVRRKAGDLSVDRDGNFTFSGGDGWGKAIAKAVTAGMVENFTEFAGAHIPGLSRTLAGLGLRRASRWVTRVSDGSFMRAVNRGMRAMGQNGVLGEMAEEELGIALNAFLVGDNRLSDLAEWETQRDIVLGVPLSMGVMAGGTVMARAGAEARQAVQYTRYSHALDRADIVGRSQLTPERWDPIREALDTATNDGLGEALTRILHTGKPNGKIEETRGGVRPLEGAPLHVQEARAVIGYADRLLRLRGFNLGQMAAARSGEGRPEAATANASFMAGYNARTPVEKAGILTDFEALALPFMAGRTGKRDATVADALAWYRDADAGAELERIRRGHPGDKGRLRAAVTFFNAASAYEGLLAGARDRMDNAAAAARQDLRRMTYGGDGGHLQPLTLKDGRQVYLISGRAAEHRSPAWEGEDSIDSLLRRLRMGNLDPEMSDRTLVVADPVTGRLEMIPARRVRSVGELVPFDGEAERLEAEARERTARREAAEIDGATVVLTAAPVAEDAASETAAAAPVATVAEDAATVSQAAPAAPVAEDAATAVPGQEIAAEAGIPAPEVPLELNDRLDFTGPDGGAVRAEVASVPDTDGQMDVLITDGSGRERVERLTADGVRGLGTLTHRNGEPVGAAEAAEAREAAAQPSGTAAQTDAAEADNASAGPNETDGNGYPFVKSSDGTTAFGEVREESGLQPAPIRLSEGFNRADGQGGNIGYGLEHIKAGHGEQILKAGYRSVEEFVEDVARNYQEIRIGRSRRNNRTYMLLELHDEKHKRTLYVELSHDGTYWNVNSGGIFKSKYTDKNDIAWPEPTVGSSASTGAAGVVGSPAKAAEGETADRGGNSPQPISAGKVSANPPNGQAGGPETGAAPADGRVTGTGQRLTEEQADVLLSAMEADAEEAPELELTPENWVREFGEDGRVGTPVGEVKMGDHQLAKLFMKGRSGYFGMIRPTLENPDVIVEKPAPSEGAERDSKYLFIKSFTKPDGSRVVHFESVTVRRDGLEVSISSHEAEARDIKKDMQNGNVLHINEKLPLSSEWSLTEAPAREGSDLVPTPGNVSTGKDSESAATVQGKAGKSSPTGPARAAGAAAVEAPRLEGMPEWHMDAPEDARKRGARRYGGQLFTRQEPVRGVVGKEIAVKFSQKDLPRGHVVVMEASQLQPSHVQGQRNPMFFIDEAQPKNRTDAVSRYAAQRMAEGIRPEEITGSVTAYTGAPTVNSRGEVIQGNNRSDALRFLWESRLPEQQAAYTQYLTDNAERFGIDAEAVRGMRQPVLVNMLDVDDAEAIRLGQMTAQDTESGGVERIRPKNLAQKLGDGMRQFANMLLSSADDEATFGQLVDLNGAEVMKWLNQTGAISSTQYQSAFDRKGNLTPEAKNDLQKVLYQSVFKGGAQQLEELFEKLPSKAQRAILATAYRDMDSPSAGKMLHEIQASIVAYSELMRTADFAAARKMENVLWAVESFRRQIALDDRFKPYMPADNFSNFALHLAAMYKASDFSQKTLAATFSQMYDLAQGKVGATLFEEADTTEHPLAEVIEKVLGIKYKPAKNGNGNVANGGPSVALPDQTGQGGEPRGNEPPAGGEQAPPGAGPSERGGRAADDGAAARAEAALTGNAPAGPDGQKRGPAESPVSVIDKARQAVAAEEAKAGRRAGEDGRMAGRGLSPDEARRVVAWMEGSAAVAPELELTPENWHAEFGEDGRVATPIAEVRMGDNQYLKIAQQGRNGKLGMVKPTLEHPMVIIEDERPATDGNGERPSAYVFVRAFVKKDGSRYYHFTSVTVSKDGHEVVISNQEKSAKRISTLLRQGKVAWIDKGFSLHPTAQIEKPVPLNDTNRPTTPGSQPALLGINSSEPKVTSGNAPANTMDTGKTLPGNGNDTATPESTVSSAGKDSENGGNGQGKAGKSAVEEAAAEPPYGRPYTSAADFLETAHSEIAGDDRLDGATVRKLKAFVERALKKRLGWATEVDERGARVDSSTVKGLYSSEKDLFWPFRDHGASWIDDGEKAVYYLAYYPAQYKGQDDVVRVRKEYFEEGTGTEVKGFSPYMHGMYKFEQVKHKEKVERLRRRMDYGLANLRESDDPLMQIKILLWMESKAALSGEDVLTEAEKAEIAARKAALRTGGYEWEALRPGMAYDEGMKATVEFNQNMALGPGERRIRLVRRPQITKDGKTVQTAAIVVEEGPYDSEVRDIRHRGEPSVAARLAAALEAGIIPVGYGKFGPVYDQFKGKPQEAVAFLLDKKSGEATDVLHHKDIGGGISLVWGYSRAGLEMIAQHHPEVLGGLQEMLDGMHIAQETENRIKLESDTHFAVVSKKLVGRPSARWLLTAYEEKNSALDNTTDTGKTLPGNGNDTATPESTVSSAGKDSENGGNGQGKAGKSSPDPDVRLFRKRDRTHGAGMSAGKTGGKATEAPAAATVGSTPSQRVPRDGHGGLRFRGDGGDGDGLTAEERGIVEKAKADGSYMKAPNGKATRLTGRQWAQVRTRAFKDWFGDWEKALRVEKLRKSKPVKITGEEYKGKYDLNRNDAQKWIKANLRGKYTNRDTGETIELRKDGAQKVTSHSMGNEAHLKSIAVIPQLIENSIFIDELPNEKGNGKYDSYRYYVCGLNIGGVDYTAKVTIGVKGASKYYDHSLTEIGKGTLIDNIDALTPTFDADKNASVSAGKDTKLVSILQVESSKVVDGNGEPLVVYHGSRTGNFSVFDDRQGDKESDAREGTAFFARSRATAYSYSGSNDSPTYGEKRDGDGSMTDNPSVYETFLNMRDPLYDDFEGADWQGNAAGKALLLAVGEDGHREPVYKGDGSALFEDYSEAEEYAGGHGMEDFDIQEDPSIGRTANDVAREAMAYNDGIIINNVVDNGRYGTDGATTVYAVFSPGQIKSATDNRGTFSSRDNDIRFRENGEEAAMAEESGLDESLVRQYAEAMRKKNLSGATRAEKEMKRKLLLEGGYKSLGAFVKAWKPVETVLKERFGDVEALRQEYVERKLSERGVMEAARKKAEEAAERKRKRQSEFEMMDTDTLDSEYTKALEKGDKIRMRDLVDEAARRNGYAANSDGYQGAGAWVAPADPGYATAEERRAAMQEDNVDVNVTDIAAGVSPQPDDIFSNLRAYVNGTPEGRESVASIGKAIEAAKAGRKATVRVYRAVPSDIKEGSIRNGDWVTPSRKYAEMHGENRLQGKYRIIEQDVPASDLWWDGNDVNEWGYDDGSDYTYRNSRNNRKLRDLVTRDGKGNVIPLSERFNPRKKDVRFRLGDPAATFGARQEAAVESRGTVAPGLNGAEVKVVEVPRHEYKGTAMQAKEQAASDARGRYLDGNGAPKTLRYDNFGRRFDYTISGNSIAESMNPTAQHKSANLGAHIAVLNRLPEVIGQSVEAEEHPDYAKNAEGKRTTERVNPNVLVHRFYGAVEIDGEVYRVKTTMKENRNPSVGNSQYTYEVTNVEVLTDIGPASTSNGMGHTYLKTSSGNVPLAKLLHGVEKSHDPGKKLLSESDDLTDFGHFREKAAFADGQRLPISETVEDGRRAYRVEGLGGTFASREELLDAFREKYPGYVSALEGGALAVEPWGKYLAGRRPTAAERRSETAYLSRKTRRAREAVAALAARLNLDGVEVLLKADGLSGARARAKGWYDLSTGKIVIVLPNHADVGDVVRTLLHEGVAHHGLRQLFGRRFDTFLDNVLSHAAPDVRQEIVSLAARRGWDFRTATEEYLAGLAEDTDFERAERQGWWRRIKEWFLGMLRDLGLPGFSGGALTDSELRYVLWRSYENLRDPGRYRNVFAVAEDVAMQSRLGVGDYAAGDGPRESRVAEPARDMASVNSRFNEQLAKVSNENIQGQVFELGRPSSILVSGGIDDRPIKLYGSKIAKKMRKHGFSLSELRNLPQALADPIAVFNNYGRNGNRAVLTELHTAQGNVLVTIEIGKGIDADFDIVSSIFGKTGNSVVNWLNKGFATYINKEKALNYLHLAAPIAAASSNQELSSAAKVVENFENPPVGGEKNEGGAGVLFRDVGEGLAEINAEFNDRLSVLTAENADRVTLSLGRPSAVLRSAGVEDRPMKLYGNKVMKKMRKHGFTLGELRDLPRAVADPVAVFDNYQKDGNRTILTESRSQGNHIMVAVTLGENGADIEFNIVSSVFGKGENNVLNWINKGYATYINKEKALRYLHFSESSIPEASTSQELSSAAKVVEKFGNPPVEARKNEDDGILFRDGDGEGPLVPSSSGLDAGEMASRLRQEADRGAAREREGAAAVRERCGVNVRDAYDRQVASSAYQSVEALQDSMLGLKTLMMDIWKAEGRERTGLRHIEDIPAFENAYLAENRMSSANKVQADEYTRDFMAPLLEEVRRLTYGDGAGRRKAAWKRNYGGVTDYMMAKHGLERNEVMARREAERKFARERQKAERQLARIEARHAGNPGALEGDSAYQELQDRLQDIDGRVEAQYLENRKKDYAGLTGLTGADTVAVAEEKAREAVASFEAAHETAELWRLVNAATGQTLRTLYEAGLLDKARYEEIRGMYAHYIPLRGFAGTTSDEVYGYLEDRDALERGNILKRARGRSTKADDPLATVAAMAEAGIAQANRNRMKQAFMNFAINHPSDAVTVGDMWLHYDGADGQWHPVFPDIGAGDDAETVARKLKDFNAAMRERAWEAPEDYLHGKDAVGVPYIIRPGDMREHQVIVRRGGRDFVLTVNGSPRAAQALNGLSNPSSIEGKLLQAAANVAGYVTRAMSQWYTQRNPSFVMGNFIRDMQYANSTVWVKESAAYARRFNLNCAKYNPAALRALFHKYRRGTLDMGKPVEKYFHEFMHEGGETGYTIQRDIDNQRKIIMRTVRRNRVPVGAALHMLFDQWDLVNRSVENTARFAAYLTSRQMGRDVGRSVWDAKEISVNFNKKGAGGTFFGAKGQTATGNTAAAVSAYGRSFIAFFNAGMQGMANNLRAAKRGPWKFAMKSAFLLGANMALMALFDGGGDDDDGEGGYYSIPGAIRRSHVCFVYGGDRYIKIPLSVEDRAMYGLGELAMSVLIGKEDMSSGELTAAVASLLSQLLPVDMMEDGGALMAWVPTMARPVAEAALNKDWTGQPVYRPGAYLERRPGWEKAYPSTNQILVQACKRANELTGGDETRQGLVNINPAIMGHLASGYLGQFPLQLLNNAATAAGLRDFDLRDVPLQNRLVGKIDERAKEKASRDAYFKYMNEYGEVSDNVGDYRSRISRGDGQAREQLAAYMETEAYKRYRVMKPFQDAMAPLRDFQKEAGTSEAEQEAVGLASDRVRGMMLGKLSEEKRAGYPARPLHYRYLDSGTEMRLKIAGMLLNRARALRRKDETGGSFDAMAGQLRRMALDQIAAIGAE